MSLRIFASFCALLFVLSGCGGGGGGGREEQPFTISFTTSNISLTALEAGGGGPAIIGANGSGPSPDNLFIGATATGQGIALPIQVTIDQASRSASITVMPNNNLPLGTHTGTLTLMACKDASCSSHFRGSPHTVNYTVNVVPRLTVSPANATLSVAERTVGSAATHALLNPANGAFTTSITYLDNQGWLTATAQGSALSLIPNATNLGIGTYRAEVWLQMIAPSQSAFIPVTLTVTPAIQTPATVSIQINGGTLPSQLQQSFVVGVASGAPVTSWTATSNASWLVLDQSSGAPNQPLSWHLDLAAFNASTNHRDHTARVTISGGTAVAPVVTTFVASKRLPEVGNLERLALLENQAGSVSVYGEGFNTIQNPAVDVRVAGATPTAVTVVSDRLLSISLPALAVGDYPVSIANALGIPTRIKPITVVAPVTRTYQAIDTDGQKRVLLWDAITQSAYTINTVSESVMRFDLSGATVSVTSRPIPGIENIGLPLDRSVLYAVNAGGSLLDLNKATLETTRVRALGDQPYHTIRPLPLTITADNTMWLAMGPPEGQWSNTLLTYDLLNSEPKTMTPPPAGFSFYSGPWSAVSGNGRRLFMTQSATSSGAPMLQWDQADATLKVLPFSNDSQAYFYDLSGDRLGERWLFDDLRVRNFAREVQGELQMPENWLAVGRVISRDGKRAYIFSLHSSSIGSTSEPDPIEYFPRVYTFDTSSAAPAGTGLPLLGHIELTDYAGCRAYQLEQHCFPFVVGFTITDDERTLLAVGDRRFIVIPIPPELRE